MKIISTECENCTLHVVHEWESGDPPEPVPRTWWQWLVSQFTLRFSDSDETPAGPEQEQQHHAI